MQSPRKIGVSGVLVFFWGHFVFGGGWFGVGICQGCGARLSVMMMNRMTRAGLVVAVCGLAVGSGLGQAAVGASGQ